jgi:hypothetical protein
MAHARVATGAGDSGAFDGARAGARAPRRPRRAVAHTPWPLSADGGGSSHATARPWLRPAPSGRAAPTAPPRRWPWRNPASGAGSAAGRCAAARISAPGACAPSAPLPAGTGRSAPSAPPTIPRPNPLFVAFVRPAFVFQSPSPSEATPSEATPSEATQSTTLPISPHLWHTPPNLNPLPAVTAEADHDFQNDARPQPNCDIDASGPPYDGAGLPQGDSPTDAGSLTSLTLTGLAAGTPYYVTVTSHDAQGQESWYATQVDNADILSFSIYLPLVLRR